MRWTWHVVSAGLLYAVIHCGLQGDESVLGATTIAPSPALAAVQAWASKAGAAMGLDGTIAVEFECLTAIRDMTVSAGRAIRKHDTMRYRYRVVLRPPCFRFEGIMVDLRDGKEQVVSKSVNTFDGVTYYELDLLSGELTYSKKRNLCTVDGNINPIAEVFSPVLGQNRPNVMDRELPYDFLTYLLNSHLWIDLGIKVDEINDRAMVVNFPVRKVTQPEPNYFPGLRYRYAFNANGLPKEIIKETIAVFPEAFRAILGADYFPGKSGTATRLTLPQDDYVGDVERKSFTYVSVQSKTKVGGKVCTVTLPQHVVSVSEAVIKTRDETFARHLDALPALKTGSDTWSIPSQEEEFTLSGIMVGHDCDEEFSIDPSYAVRIKDLDQPATR